MRTTPPSPMLATPADIGPLATMLAEAFADDPMISWPMPAATASARELLFAAVLEPCLDLGALWTVAGRAGAAVWRPPSAAAATAAGEGALRARIAPLTSDGGARYAVFWDWLDARMPPYPVWYLDVLGVAPLARRTGLGRQLVEHGLQLARADGCPAFLETGVPGNVGYYESLGFEVRAEERAPDGGPTIWCMEAS